MRTYVIRRLLLTIPTLFLVSLIVFFTIRLLPGDIIDIMVAGQMTGMNVANINRAAVEHDLGLDEPVFVQYGRWLGVVPQADGKLRGIFQGNLGNSLWKKRAINETILKRLPVSIELGVLSLLFSQLIALPVGIYSALRQESAGDYVARSFATITIAIPYFWLGTLVIVFPSIWWGWSPPLTLVPFNEDPIGNVGMFIVPAIILGMALSGVTMRMTRTMMLEVMRQDYIRTAWSKGLKERTVIMRHGLKNALIPIVTIVGLQLPIILGGAVVIEQIFSLPGVGRLLLDAVADRDYVMVSGIMFVYAAGLVLINLIIDLTYAYLDPRIHYK